LIYFFLLLYTIGNNGRLVVTALTDRCYVTLTTAILLKKGGAPQGPAGTGKTETVKDLGKAMAKFVLVFNCSEGLDSKSLGRMFSGLMQTGGWGCFDEFNRIEVEVLSVVAQQIHQILDALRDYHPDRYPAFAFEGEVISINEQCQIYITMNPGYAGRSELPDNLKSLFRPISMMVPENTMICEIMLQSEGFKYGKPLSLKMVTLYNLMIQQLSKQDHYDFGLRAIKSVLSCAGIIRREKAPVSTKDKDQDKEFEQDEQLKEQIILMRAIRDMNMPKFVAEDVPLFQALFNDIFPNVDIPDAGNVVLQDAIEQILKKEGYQVHPPQIAKIIQLYDTKNTRHGNMLVGSTLSGKSTSWKTLQKALNLLHKEPNSKFPAVKAEFLNPKSITINELFGYVDANTMEWTEGVLSSMMSRLCKEENEDEIHHQRWMILDGPVDTVWIESMNTVLDDNKVLTLLNGDRISLPPEVGLIFEVEDLSVASPATVSRCGMVYLDQNDLTWEPISESWIEKFSDEMLKETLRELFQRWVPKMLREKKGKCKELVPGNETASVLYFCKLLDALAAQDATLNWNNPKKDEIYWNLLEKWFTFGLIWSIGASVTEEGRHVFDVNMREIESMFPHVGSIYDYLVSSEKNEWISWEERLGAAWRPLPNTPYHAMFVPTSDTARNR
jgi:dynein heavy chain, axonemal